MGNCGASPEAEQGLWGLLIGVCRTNQGRAQAECPFREGNGANDVKI